MSRRKNVALFATGILAGALLTVPTARAAEAYLKAFPSSQEVILDGESVKLEAYNIEGNNFVKLRDIGEAAGFNVWWDGRNIQIYTNEPYTGIAPTAAPRGLTCNPDGSINVPGDGSRYIPQAGDIIRCDDGSNYTITDVSRYDASMFADGPLPPLPEPICDWSLFPDSPLPAPEVRRFNDQHSDRIFIRNLYETRRMQYTLYNAISENEITWQNGAPALRGDGTQMARVELKITNESAATSFWPWKPERLTDSFYRSPARLFQIEAWDVYKNGIFSHTEYRVAAT